MDTTHDPSGDRRGAAIFFQLLEKIENYRAAHGHNAAASGAHQRVTPPDTVASTRMSRRSSGSVASGSSETMIRSANLNGSRLPTTASMPMAWAASRHNMR